LLRAGEMLRLGGRHAEALAAFDAHLDEAARCGMGFEARIARAQRCRRSDVTVACSCPSTAAGSACSVAPMQPSQASQSGSGAASASARASARARATASEAAVGLRAMAKRQSAATRAGASSPAANRPALAAPASSARARGRSHLVGAPMACQQQDPLCEQPGALRVGADRIERPPVALQEPQHGVSHAPGARAAPSA
jgi:hypothetical protein